MRVICILFLSALFTVASAKNYYVSPDGDDNGSGSIDDPWATWGYAFNSPYVKPGDVVYFRGGVYPMTDNNLNWPYTPGRGYTISVDGRVGDTVRFWAYPGEVPILDCDNVNPCDGYEHNDNYAIRAGDVNYVHFKGLVVRNVWQKCGTSEVDGAFRLANSSNIIIENCSVYNTGGIGFKVASCDEVYFINCDSWNNCDALTSVPASNPVPGNDGSGFQDFNWTDEDFRVYFKGCRAWNCGDQGFSSGSIGYTEYENCWSFNNGLLEGAGHGFKLGWINETPLELKRYYHNCIAAYNRASGFTTNDQGYPAQAMNLYNNTAYHNGYYDEWPNPVYGFWIYNSSSMNTRELTRTLKNNISYKNESGPVEIGTGAVCTQEYNSWNNLPGVNITDSDFISLDSTGLSGARQSDGSLPDIDFLKLAPGSALIDAGTNVGLPYAGMSPDLGAYEYKETESNMLPSVEIISPSTGSKTTPPATVEIAVKAFDVDGDIVKVELYDGNNKIADIPSPPWSFTWEDIEEGSYSLTAVAIDNKNEKATSPPVSLFVEDEITPGSQSDFMLLYPNPNKGLFSISFNEPMQIEAGELIISTIGGLTVYRDTMMEGETCRQFDLSHLKPGIYILTFIKQKIIATKRFIKQ